MAAVVALALFPSRLGRWTAGDPSGEFVHDLKQTRWMGAIIILVLLMVWETAAPFFSQFQKCLRDRAVHAWRNLLLGILNSLMIALFFVGLWLWASQWAEAHRFGLLNWRRWTGWAHAAGAILLFDLWMYAWHRMNHRLPFLWRFHRTHHSDLKMDVTTAHRFHLGEIFFSSWLRVPVIFLLGMHFWELVLYEILQFAVVQFHHANVGLPDAVEGMIRTFIVTPAMHKVHHSRWRPETDSNYSSLFSFWDRIFRSFRWRSDPHTIEFGVDGFDREEQHTVVGLLKTPLDQPKRTE